ncbi:O-fucosyltransferase family protein [Actinidia rufa]|uniref:O-fucosyltransferase family protein n=1 Tax=Actinidia rufa TaxID=165716 RepID=A0A7J0FBX2_9ERIC|nr:O-fucosyltransferase family protein [Actinidia rufa]
MQRRRWRWTLGVLRKLIICTIGSISLLALLYAHLGPPDSYKLPMQQEIGFQKLGGERRWKLEVVQRHLSRAPLPARKICDMVAVARVINATLVIPELDKRSFWQDTSNFSDVFDEDHFISSLANDVRVIKKLPEELTNATRAVMHFRSWSGINYYQDEIASLWADYQVIRAAKSDSRLANNNLPPDIQKLRCRACYDALRFSPTIEAMGKLLVNRMRSYGPYIALHLRYEKDMLAFSGCTHDLSPEEADELTTIRENTSYWKVKDINSTEQRAKGYCPLTPKEIGVFLTALGFPSNTPIYIAAGEIYGRDSHMADLKLRYPLLMDKEKLASAEELEPFINHASQMAALDYIVKALVHHFDKIEQGTLKEGKKLSARIIEIHRRRQGSPRKRKGPISGTKGTDRFRSEEAFYVNPLPDCLCQKETPTMNTSVILRMLVYGEQVAASVCIAEKMMYKPGEDG